MTFFQNVKAKVEQLVQKFEPEVKADLERELQGLETAVKADLATLKTDATNAVANAAPEVQAAVQAAIVKFEQDLVSHLS